jgi:sugar phosphate isomerase/epimerase
MRLAISNIAWPSGQDELIAPVLIGQGAQGVEIAPTKVWRKPLEVSGSELADYRHSWERRGLQIVALQALLFGQPGLALFKDEATRRHAVEYLKGMIVLAAALGAESLVFGSPKNRRAGERPRAEVEAIAMNVFRELGEFAVEHQVFFCIEPNPTTYDCDFLTNAADGLELVERVGCEGFGLHLDTGAMMLASDSFASTFSSAIRCWRHFHVSEPHLVQVGHGMVDHSPIAVSVRASGYTRWLSIEMREASTEDGCVQAVRGSLAFVRGVYFSSRSEPIRNQNHALA